MSRVSYTAFKEHFSQFGVFSLCDIRKVYPDFDRRRLSEWQDKSHIQKVTNKWYFFRHNDSSFLNEQFKFFISNRIYSCSYVSLECALSYYGLIPEGVFTITSVSSLKTKRFETPIGTFDYRSVSPRLFFGYTLVKYNSFGFLIAEPEKALIDLLYLRKELENKDDYLALRLNHDMYHSMIDLKKLNSYLEFINIKSLSMKFKVLTECLNAQP